jgi:hypothetical protein
MKRVICDSGLAGYQGFLQDNYGNYEQYLTYTTIYGVHTRLGYDTPLAAWKANPIIRGSVEPSDFRKVT